MSEQQDPAQSGPDAAGAADERATNGGAAAAQPESAAELEPSETEAAPEPDGAAPELRTVIASETVSIRRAPKVSVFLVLGALVGMLTALVLTSLFPVDKAIGFGATFGYLALYGIPAGIVLGGLLALLLDRRASRRAREVTIEHERVEPAE